MDPDILDILRTCRRSRIVDAVYDSLESLGSALPAELADAARTTTARVIGALHGNEDYRPESSLVALGVAVARDTDRGVCYELTERGRRVRPAIRERLRAARTRRLVRLVEPAGGGRLRRVEST